MTQFLLNFSSPQGKKLIGSEIFLFCILFKMAKILFILKINYNYHYFLKISLEHSWFIILCLFQGYKQWLSYTYIPSSFRFLSCIGHYKAMNRVLCGILLFFSIIYSSIYQSQFLNLSLTPIPLLTATLFSISVTVFLFCR